MFRDSTGRQHCLSTHTADRRVALKVASALSKVNELAGRQTLSVDRVRKLIQDTVTDILEGHDRGLSADGVKAFFEQAAVVAGQGGAIRQHVQKFVANAIGNVAAMHGEALPSANVRDWCKRWLALKELEAEPRTHERYATCIDRFLKFLGPQADRDLSSLRTEDVLRWRDATARRLAVSSVNVELKIIRVCLGAAVKQDLVPKNAAASVSILKQRGESKRRAFTLAEVQRILKQCDTAGGEWRGLCLVAAYTGQRLGDVARLTWDQLDLGKGEVSFVTEKTGKRLCLPLAAPLRDYLLAQPSTDDPKAYVFPRAGETAENRVGTLSNRFYDEILAPAGLATARDKHKPTTKGRDAKRSVSELSFHSFRHTLTTWLKAAGASNALAGMIVGHDSEVVSRGYTHLEGHAAEWLKKLPDVTKGGGGAGH